MAASNNAARRNPEKPSTRRPKPVVVKEQPGPGQERRKRMRQARKSAEASSSKGRSETSSSKGRSDASSARARSAATRSKPRPATVSAAALKAPAQRAVTGRRALINQTPLAYVILIPTVALLLLGLVMVFSAGSIVGSDNKVAGYSTFLMQLMWAGIGVGLMWFFAKFDYHKLGKLSWAAFIGSTALLALVLVIGREAYGAKRWIMVGPINVQPTELAKFALVLFAAYVLSVKGKKVRELKHLLVPVVLFALLDAALMMVQPDLGSTLVLLATIMLMLIVADTNPSHLAAMATAGGAAALILAIAAPYRRARLFSFINPWKSPKGYGYHVIQSYIALGSGNIKGLGLGMSRQKFLYLPNAHTDFIFAVIGEELGILGTMTVVCLVAILAYGGMRIAKAAPDDMGMLLAVGITGLIVIQAFVNMGGVTGLLPITGVPLPLVSSGGSSLIVCMACIGILLNIAAQSKARG